MEIPSISVPDPRVFVPRDYQKPFFHALSQRDISRYLLIWHRRAGKDWCAMNGVAYLVGEYYAHKPIVIVALAGKSKSQGGNILWDGRTNQGNSYIDAFPPELVKKTDSRELSVHFKNGSVFKILTTRDPDVIRGMNPTVVLISEYDYIDGIHRMFTEGVSPILEQNGGKCIITTTPAGVRQAYGLYLRSRGKKGWFSELRGANDTIHNGERVLTDEMIAQSRIDGMSEAQVQREYFVNFFAEGESTFYEHEFRKIREEERVTTVPHDPMLPVHTFWDLGRDMTSIWFVQITRAGQWRWIDYHAGKAKAFPHYLNILSQKRSQFDYNYGLHCAPHDFNHENIRSSVTLDAQARQQGYQFIVAPKLPIMDGINLMRNILDKSVFDGKKTFDGVEGLKHYKRQPSKLEDRFGHPLLTDKPLHDDASHPADAARTGAVLKDKLERFNLYGYNGNTNGYQMPIQTKMASAQKRDEAQQAYGYQQRRNIPGSGPVIIDGRTADQYLKQPPKHLGYNVSDGKRGL